MPIATNPVASDVHVNRPLTNFGQAYIQGDESFVGLRAMPNLPVQFQSDLYNVWSRADFFRDEAEVRADGTESAGGSFNLTRPTYTAEVIAFHKDVTDRQRANSDPGINLDAQASRYVSQKLMVRREVLFASVYMQGSDFWSGTDVDAIWGGAGNPITDIRAGIEEVQGNTGFRPNKMLIGRTGWNTLLDNADILARITGGALPGQPAIVQRTLLAQLFEMDEIFVVDAVVNSAAEGATEDTAFIAPDDCLIYYAPNAVDLEEPTAGIQFSWTGFTGATPSGFRISRFRHQLVASDRVEGEMAFVYVVVATELGKYFTAVSDVT
jgi:hypothetical protein